METVYPIETPEFRDFCNKLHKMPYYSSDDRVKYHQVLCEYLNTITDYRKDHNLKRFFTEKDKDILKWYFYSAMKYINAVNQMENEYNKRLKIVASDKGITFTLDTIANYPEFDKI